MLPLTNAARPQEIQAMMNDLCHLHVIKSTVLFLEAKHRKVQCRLSLHKVQIGYGMMVECSAPTWAHARPNSPEFVLHTKQEKRLVLKEIRRWLSLGKMAGHGHETHWWKLPFVVEEFSLHIASKTLSAASMALFIAVCVPLTFATFMNPGLQPIIQPPGNVNFGILCPTIRYMIHTTTSIAWCLATQGSKNES